MDRASSFRACRGVSDWPILAPATFYSATVLNQLIQVEEEQKMKNSTATDFRYTKPLGLVVLAVLLPGCSTTNPQKTFSEVTVRPGESSVCASSPCTVYFETPAGSGTHNILQNGTIKAGVAIGGQRVSLGEYSAHSVMFRVEGTDLPVAHLSVVGGPE
jgi:hypothetical protein